MHKVTIKKHFEGMKVEGEDQEKLVKILAKDDETFSNDCMKEKFQSVKLMNTASPNQTLAQHTRQLREIRTDEISSMITQLRENKALYADKEQNFLEETVYTSPRFRWN